MAASLEMEVQRPTDELRIEREKQRRGGGWLGRERKEQERCRG
jgi:hypothetical protein